MKLKNLLVISSDFPDKNDTYIGNIFVKEQIRYIKNYFENVYVISPVAYGVERFRNTSYEDYEFDNVKVFFPKYLNVPLFYFYGQQLWVSIEHSMILKLIKKLNLTFDIIHAHFTWPSGVVAAKLKKEFNVPLIITEHTSNTFYQAIDLKDSKFIESWNQSDAIIRMKRSDITLFYDVGIPKNKVHYIPNGCDVNKFSLLDMKKCRNELGLPLNKKIILSVGHLSEVKGHYYLIDAVKQLINYRDDILCIIVGDGKLRQKLEKQIKENEIGDYVKLVGSKPYSEIPLWMNACDLFVLPSLKESFGVVQIEAMSCGKPVISTYNGGSEEIIISEDYGLLCEPRNSKSLAEALIIGINGNYDQNKLVSYAKSYSYNNISKEVSSIYSDLLICSESSS